tara:strand:+ start:319 stop:555 length:237 start_codon:yes stop_codon:yes gene_type:complete
MKQNNRSTTEVTEVKITGPVLGASLQERTAKYSHWAILIKNMSDDDLGLHDLLAGMSPQTVETKIFRQLLQEEYTNRK